MAFVEVKRVIMRCDVCDACTELERDQSTIIVSSRYKDWLITKEVQVCPDCASGRQQEAYYNQQLIQQELEQQGR